MHLSTDPWIWVGALLTFCIFSFLVKDNPLYKFAEHTFVGVSMGYTIVLVTWSTAWPDLFEPLFVRNFAQVPVGAKVLLIIPMILGLFYFAAFIPKINWTMRIPMSFLYGYSMGVYIPSDIQANLLKQVRSTLLTPDWLTRELPQGMSAMAASLVHIRSANSVVDALLSLIWALRPLIILIGAIATIAYFFFSREHKGVLKPIANTGIIFLMIGFGASFGYTVMARLSLFIGQVQFLLHDWLGLI
jgi:hypothetical protein